jgi:hypothetical protein
MFIKVAQKAYYFALFVLILLIQAGPAKAESGIWSGLKDCRKSGDCSLNDFIRLLVNIFDFILGITGSLALLVFVYGGILFLFSGGNSDQIEKGKKALTGAVIGLAIIFASYVIVHFTAEALGVKGAEGIFNSEAF